MANNVGPSFVDSKLSGPSLQSATVIHIFEFVINISDIDSMAKMVSLASSSLANFVSARGSPVRPLFSRLTDIHPDAPLPKWTSAKDRAHQPRPEVQLQLQGPAAQERVLLFPGCFSNYNQPNLAAEAIYVLNKQGVHCESVYPGCCGMPQLEQGDLASVSKKAASAAKELACKVQVMQAQSNRSVTVVSLTPSCSFMIKSEWPLLLPYDENVKFLSSVTADISEFVSKIFKKYGAAPGMAPLPKNERAILHSACHARAQNIGNRAQQILKYIPKLSVSVVSKCSGHGGLWGCKSLTHASALKTGQAAKVAIEKSIETANKEVNCSVFPLNKNFLSLCLRAPAQLALANVRWPPVISRTCCPLAPPKVCPPPSFILCADASDPGAHAADAVHPIQLIARSYRLGDEQA
jgi:glycerol-3-phosphate dehydrogenase subunit C